MRIAKIIGTVTLSRQHRSLDGATLKLAMPLLIDEQSSEWVNSDELITAWDELGCGVGTIAAVSEGPEATRPFRPELKPIDAYVTAILDSIDLDEAAIGSLKKQNNEIDERQQK